MSPPGAKIVKKMVALKASEERQDRVQEKLLSTHNFQTVQAVCQDAYTNHKMIALVGEAGYGKTTALKYFQATHKYVFYMTVKPSMTGKTFWLSLFDALSPSERSYFGINTPRALYFIIRAVASFLNSFDKSLLIIDEAGKFSRVMLEQLHELRDETKNSAGIVLAGPGYFRRNLTKWALHQRIGMPEIYRRINYWEELLPPERSEITEFCRHYGIEDSDAIRKMALDVRNFGELHNHVVEYLSGNFRL